MTQRSSIALFLATAGLLDLGGSVLSSAEPLAWPLSQSAQAHMLAEAVECVPIGEGENCERQSIDSAQPKVQSEPKVQSGGPAADDSVPTSNPGASDGSAEDTLNLIERGDL